MPTVSLSVKRHKEDDHGSEPEREKPIFFVAERFASLSLETPDFLKVFEGLYGVKGLEAVRNHSRFQALIVKLEALDESAQSESARANQAFLESILDLSVDGG